MKFKDFILECEKLDIEVDKDIKALTEEEVEGFEIDFKLPASKKAIKMTASRKVKSLADAVKVKKAIKVLRKEGVRVDFPEVVERSGVSDPTVRKYYGTEIVNLRKLKPKAGASTALPNVAKSKRSDDSKDVLIATQRAKIDELMEEIADLKKAETILTSANIELGDELERLKRILKGYGREGE